MSAWAKCRRFLAVSAKYRQALTKTGSRMSSPRETMMKEFFLTTALLTAALSVTAPSVADARPCLIVTLTGTQGGPQSFNGLYFRW